MCMCPQFHVEMTRLTYICSSYVACFLSCMMQKKVTKIKSSIIKFNEYYEKQATNVLCFYELSRYCLLCGEIHARSHKKSFWFLIQLLLSQKLSFSASNHIYHQLFILTKINKSQGFLVFFFCPSMKRTFLLLYGYIDECDRGRQSWRFCCGFKMIFFLVFFSFLP